MNIQQIQQLLLTHKSARSTRHISRYVKLMDHYLKNPCVKSKDSPGMFEHHHMLPRKMWPEYVNSSWNKVTLPTKAHYIAHYLLYKSFSHRSCVFAFNQMRRVSQTPNGNCQLYQSARLELAQVISQVNTGRVMSEQNRKRKSEMFKGTNVYRNQINGKLMRFKTSEVPPGWEPFQTGRVRTEQSKTLIANKMVNRIWQYDPITKDVKFVQGLLPGYVEGYPDWLVTDQASCIDTKWIHCVETGESLRIPQDSQIPEGHVLGRGSYNNKGFSQINNQSVMKVINLEQKTYQVINRSDYDPTLHMQSGQQLDQVVVYQYKNKIYTQYLQLMEANPELPQLRHRSIQMNHMVIPKPHFNQTQERQEFCRLNQGKKPGEVGLSAIPLLSFKYQKERIYVKS